MTHIQKHSQSNKSLCCVWVYIYLLCVREREREKRRFVQYHKSQAIQLKTRYKKSVEVQINEEEVGGGGGGN